MKTIIISGKKPSRDLLRKLGFNDIDQLHNNINSNYKTDNYLINDLNNNLEGDKIIKLFDSELNYYKKNHNIYLFTNNPYILNYINLLIIKYDKTGEGLKYEDLEVIYNYDNIEYESLKAVNERLIYTNYASDIIN